MHQECVCLNMMRSLSIPPIFILGEYYLPGSWREVITKFRGCKIQIIQDEYRQINEMKEAMLNFGFSWVFSSLGKDNLRKVYFLRIPYLLSNL